MKPWEQQPTESGQAYKAFCVYRDLGLERQIKLAYRTATKRPASEQVSGRWNQWAKRYEWDQRARAYDAHLANVEQQALELRRRQQESVTDQFEATRYDPATYFSNTLGWVPWEGTSESPGQVEVMSRPCGSSTSEKRSRLAS